MVEKQQSVFEETDHDHGIDVEKEAVSFDLSSLGKDAGGSINTFKYREDLKDLQKHFLALNEKGELHTWSFVKDNVLLILTGNVPEEIARLYETALAGLEK